jgi:hypothetical protein
MKRLTCVLYSFIDPRYLYIDRVVRSLDADGAAKLDNTIMRNKLGTTNSFLCARVAFLCRAYWS